jgi:hypothetical protein
MTACQITAVTAATARPVLTASPSSSRASLPLIRHQFSTIWRHTTAGRCRTNVVSQPLPEYSRELDNSRQRLFPESGKTVAKQCRKKWPCVFLMTRNHNTITCARDVRMICLSVTMNSDCTNAPKRILILDTRKYSYSNGVFFLSFARHSAREGDKLMMLWLPAGPAFCHIVW